MASMSMASLNETDGLYSNGNLYLAQCVKEKKRLPFT